MNTIQKQQESPTFLLMNTSGNRGHEAPPYETYPSPIRSAFFAANQVSRINMTHFMAELITDNATGQSWCGEMPFIYSQG